MVFWTEVVLYWPSIMVKGRIAFTLYDRFAKDRLITILNGTLPTALNKPFITLKKIGFTMTCCDWFDWTKMACQA